MLSRVDRDNASAVAVVVMMQTIPLFVAHDQHDVTIVVRLTHMSPLPTPHFFACCVFTQLVRQYPSSFEFTGHYLERLVEALYSAAFLTFAGTIPL